MKSPASDREPKTRAVTLTSESPADVIDPKIRAEIESLELAAFRALSGADYVRQRLLHGLSMGTPSLEAEAYLIKSRVKDASSLVIKVLERREAKPDYTADDVRDIIGLRLLTLFRSELPLILGKFLNFVQWAQRPPFSLFFGANIKDCIEEIKIYGIHDPFDPNLSFYRDEFAGYGFHTRDESRTQDGVFVDVVHKQSGYSSIHLVVWANGPTQSRTDRVPIEVQLRTSLEDAWGEMDHRLRYKRRSEALFEYLTHGTPPRLSEGDGLADEDLRILKSSLDNCSRSADLIQRRINARETGSGIIRRHQKFVSSDIDRLYDLGLSQGIQEKLSRTVERLHNVYRELLCLDDVPPEALLEEAHAAFRDGADQFRDYILSYTAAPFEDQVRDVEVRYSLMMERALCFYWQALVITAGAGSGSKHARENEVDHMLRLARVQYEEVGQLSGMALDPVLSFRIALTLDIQGNHQLALMKLQEAVENIDKGHLLPADHHMRLRIPRQYAFAEWEAAEHIKWKSIDLGHESLLLDQRREKYLRALDVTLGLVGLEANQGALDQSTTTAEENRVTANNIIEYACSYIYTGGAFFELREPPRGLTRTAFERHLSLLLGEGIESISRFSLADTVRKAARLLGDRQLAVEAAHRVLALIGRPDFAIKLPELSYVEARRAAEAEIAQGLAPDAGSSPQW